MDFFTLGGEQNSTKIFQIKPVSADFPVEKMAFWRRKNKTLALAPVKVRVKPDHKWSAHRGEASTELVRTS